MNSPVGCAFSGFDKYLSSVPFSFFLSVWLWSSSSSIHVTKPYLHVNFFGSILLVLGAKKLIQRRFNISGETIVCPYGDYRSCMVHYSLQLCIEARRPHPFIDTNHNYWVHGDTPRNDEA